jgi:hypothetical protein
MTVSRSPQAAQQYRRIGTRYEKRAANYVAMWIMAAMLRA